MLRRAMPFQAQPCAQPCLPCEQCQAKRGYQPSVASNRLVGQSIQPSSQTRKPAITPCPHAQRQTIAKRKQKRKEQPPHHTTPHYTFPSHTFPSADRRSRILNLMQPLANALPQRTLHRHRPRRHAPARPATTPDIPPAPTAFGQ